jgi:cephalosporin hydroxylase
VQHLTELADFYGTDKGTKCHRYTDIYHSFLAPLRDRVQNVLEIGILQGASLLMWRDYFPNALVFGLDWNAYDTRQPGHERIQTALANQREPESIHAALCNWDLHRTLDRIIEDGAHTAETQVNCLLACATFMRPGGIYLVEDAEVQGFADDPFWDERYNAPLVLQAPGSVGKTVLYIRR